MYIENIVRDIKELIYDNNSNWNNVYQSKREAFQRDDLEEALYGLDQAMDAISAVDYRLKQLIDMIEMEALSAKVQSK